MILADKHECVTGAIVSEVLILSTYILTNAYYIIQTSYNLTMYLLFDKEHKIPWYY